MINFYFYPISSDILKKSCYCDDSTVFGSKNAPIVRNVEREKKILFLSLIFSPSIFFLISPHIFCMHRDTTFYLLCL